MTTVHLLVFDQCDMVKARAFKTGGLASGTRTDLKTCVWPVFHAFYSSEVSDTNNTRKTNGFYRLGEKKRIFFLKIF